MAKKIKQQQDALSKKAEEIERSKEFIEKTSFSGDESETSGELSNLDQHPADESDVVEQRARDFAIREILERESEQIAEARQRMTDGTYGTCANCGKQIAPERLQARPEATLCIDCQREREGHH